MTKATLITHGDLRTAVDAARTCYDSGHLSDNWGTKDKALLKKLVQTNKHESILRHLIYHYKIEITTKTLLALSRHQVGVNLSIQSTRYTLKKSEVCFKDTGNEYVDKALAILHNMVLDGIALGIDNDTLSALLPQNFMYKGVVTFNPQSLRHFFELRIHKNAHQDIRDLAWCLYWALPEDHKYLYDDVFSLDKANPLC